MVLRGFLKIIVLKALAESPKSGYSLMKFVEQKIGHKPSPGSIYPILDFFLNDGVIDLKVVGRSKIYSLTLKGKKNLELIEDKREECINGFSESLNLFSTLTGEDLSFHKDMVENMHNCEVPFKDVNPELDNFRNQLFKLLKSGVLKKKSGKVKRILSVACKELKSL